jgi:hypothetical protein
VSHCGLAIYIKKYLKAKEELWKFKYFTMQKYNLIYKLLCLFVCRGPETQIEVLSVCRSVGLYVGGFWISGQSVLRSFFTHPNWGLFFRNCNKADWGSSRVSRLIFKVIKIIKYLVIIYLCGSQTCFEKKKQIFTSNCLELGGPLKFFHPSKLGALFDSANFQIPGIDGSEFLKSTDLFDYANFQIPGIDGSEFLKYTDLTDM